MLLECVRLGLDADYEKNELYKWVYFMKGLKKMVPRWLRRLYLPCKIGLYDWSRFIRYSGLKGEDEQGHLLCSIVLGYHVLEKGLSMKDFRPLFGKAVIINLIRRLRLYMDSGYDCASVEFQTAMHTLNAYADVHDQISTADANAEPLPTLHDFIREHEAFYLKQTGLGGGTRSISSEDIQKAAQGSFPDLIGSRHSVRHFSGEPVSEELISKAVEWAQRSPSTCNRQCGRVIALSDKKKIQDVLAIQGGTRGFTEEIDKLLIVAGDLHSFRSPIERNQIYCDGGLFAMSLLLGLHYQGLGACSLHWCVRPEYDKQLRSLLQLDGELVVVMLIGVGSLDESFSVAFSQRISLSQVLQWK